MGYITDDYFTQLLYLVADEEARFTFEKSAENNQWEMSLRAERRYENGRFSITPQKTHFSGLQVLNWNWLKEKEAK